MAKQTFTLYTEDANIGGYDPSKFYRAEYSFIHWDDEEHPDFIVTLRFLEKENLDLMLQVKALRKDLELAKQAIMNRLNILGEGSLKNSNTSKVFMVRADSLGTLISGNTLRDAIRALNGAGNVTATISSATVTETKLGILTAAAVS